MKNKEKNIQLLDINELYRLAELGRLVERLPEYYYVYRTCGNGLDTSEDWFIKTGSTCCGQPIGKHGNTPAEAIKKVLDEE